MTLSYSRRTHKISWLIKLTVLIIVSFVSQSTRFSPQITERVWFKFCIKNYIKHYQIILILFIPCILTELNSSFMTPSIRNSLQIIQGQDL
jgi:hypothetical protein